MNVSTVSPEFVVDTQQSSNAFAYIVNNLKAATKEEKEAAVKDQGFNRCKDRALEFKLREEAEKANLAIEPRKQLDVEKLSKLENLGMDQVAQPKVTFKAKANDGLPVA